MKLSISKTFLLSILLCLASLSQAAIVNDTKQLPEVTRIMTFGDSLTYGYTLPRNATYTANLSELLSIDVLNKGFNGLTTQQALNWHINNALKEMPNPQIVIITLGGNDIMNDQRRTPAIKTNMRKVFKRFQDEGAMVVFAAIDPVSNWRSLGNFGNFMLPVIWGDFYKQMENVANEMGVVVVPKVLTGIWGNNQLTIPNDGFHPNAAGHQILTDRILDRLVAHLPAASQPTLPTTIKLEAEDFIMATKDTTPGNSGKACTRSDFPDVDFEQTNDMGGGCTLAYVKKGEGITLRANLLEPGKFDIRLRAASVKNSRANVYVNDVLMGTVVSPKNGWKTFADVAVKTPVQLAAGAHDIRIDFIDNDFNLNYVKLISTQ